MALASNEARGQSWLDWVSEVHLAPTQWSAFVEFEGEFEERENTETSKTYDFEEGIRVRQRGNILDPRIFTFDLELEPRFSQVRTEGPGDPEDTDSLELNYGVSATALRGAPYAFDFAANAARTTGDRTGDLGSRTEFELESREGLARWKNRAFPINLTYRERLREETFRSGLSNITTERDDILRTITLSGQSSKTSLRLSREMFDDRVESRNNDRETTRANLTHRLRWGKGSDLLSRADFFDQTGFAENRRITVDETAFIQHTENLSSRASYRFDLFDQETEIIQHTGNYNLRHLLYKNLTTDFGLVGTRQQSDLFVSDSYGTNLGLGYNKKIPWDGRLSLNAGGGIQITDRQSEGGLLSVFNESQAVPASQVVVLDRRFVDPASIIVTDSAGLIVFSEGIDYVIRPAGANFTEVVAISGGQIAAGDTILVNYRFQDIPSAKYYSIPYNFGARLDFGWIALFHNMSFRDEELISGDDESVLEDREDWRSGIELRWDGKDTDASATAERRFLKIDDDFETETYTFTQSASHAFSRTINLNATTSQTFTQSGDRDIAVYVFDMLLNWRPFSRLTVTPRVGAWIRQESGDVSRDESVIDYGLDARWTWRKLLVDFQYEHMRRRGDVLAEDEDRVFIRLTRRF